MHLQALQQHTHANALRKGCATHSGHDVGRRPRRHDLPIRAQKLHARGRHARAQAQHLRAQLEVAADAGAQIVDAQVNGAQLGKAAQPLRGQIRQDAPTTRSAPLRGPLAGRISISASVTGGPSKPAGKRVSANAQAWNRTGTRPAISTDARIGTIARASAS